MTNTDTKVASAPAFADTTLGITVTQVSAVELAFEFSRPLQGDAEQEGQFIYADTPRSAVERPKLMGFPKDGRLRKMLSVIDHELFLEVRLLSLEAITVIGLGPLRSRDRIISIVTAALRDGFGVVRPSVTLA